MRPSEHRLKTKSNEEEKEIIDKCLKRICNRKDISYFREMLLDLISNRSIPVDLLDFIPVLAQDATKTRFDQIYDAVMSIAFPEYKETTRKELLGHDASDTNLKIWRVALPEKFGIPQVLIRAYTFQEAFALGCDYACRVSLRDNHKIPDDLTLRVIFMSERALERFLYLRMKTRGGMQKKLNLQNREFTPKQLHGARLAALGNPRNPQHSIAKYCEFKDLQRIIDFKKSYRVSSVQSESFRTAMVEEKPLKIPSQ